MKAADLRKIFLRSLLVQGSWNFWRMQNLGFAFAMMPLLQAGNGRIESREFITRHLQRFNTHPVLTAPIVGAVSRLEEEGLPEEAALLKETLMAPYAALGDSLFGNSLKPLSAAGSLVAAFLGSILAPLICLALYNPLHLWVRLQGFKAGYSRGKEGVDFIRALNVPLLASRIRWCVAVVLGIVAFLAADENARLFGGAVPFLGTGVSLAAVLGTFWAVKKGASVTLILYGLAGVLTGVFAFL
ncbi:MAG TPA: PTS system mannose/fructose/sorbose family transporter subunit IID [Syntrophales bacterium]|nr:PTS system mannose/fructose/sorbose family transporter subunit IID [Syntrophales bacterium]HPI58375.1 PTS system mannose/fructose/sorbose family transporter subunit IID [Syntrophales bacterium]HPN26049.1 PTS system mannose/fructose/sorbose family transporter subunit IID [Syntrophales bacterium]HQM30386.1 PTS system mannose/fructose/sorbose family transporter subunit IID [Syntrophales bacterium]